MTGAVQAAALDARREALRERLRVQRARIAHQLESASAQRDVFPRSTIMRILMQRPSAARSLLVRTVVLMLCSHGLRTLVRTTVTRVVALAFPSRR